MEIKIKCDIPEKKMKRCLRWLERYNNQRRRNHQLPHATIEDALREFVQQHLTEIYVAGNRGRARVVMQKFLRADDNLQERIEKELEGVDDGERDA